MSHLSPKLLFLVAVLSLSTLGFTPAQAEVPSLTISTPYPATVVQAGEIVNISLVIKIENLPPQIVALEVTGVPEGWRADLQGNGRIIRSVYVEPNAGGNVNLNVETPADAKAGSVRLTVTARGQDAQSQLPLEFIVSESQPPQISLEAELPVLKVAPNSTINYRVTIKNKSNIDMLVNLQADAPAGFDVTFKQAFGGQELSSPPVKAGQEQAMDVSVMPAETVASGEYPIRIHAQAEQVSAQVDLTAVVIGKLDLSISMPDGRLSGEATAGQDSPIDLIVRNNGSAPAVDVKMSASPPAQWDIVFEPEVFSVQPGQEVQVKARIKPPDKAVAGDYMVSFHAIPQDNISHSVEFRITVVTSTLWGIVGLVLIAVALGVVALAVSRFGRR